MAGFNREFEFRNRVSLAFYQQITRSFVALSCGGVELDHYVALEQSRQHRAIFSELLDEVAAVVNFYGENFEGQVFGSLVIDDEIDRLSNLYDDLRIVQDNWQLLEAISFATPRTLSVQFAGYLQVLSPCACCISVSHHIDN